MTTTYYPQPSPAPRPFDRAYGGPEFGYDEPRPVMHNNFPAAMPQPAARHGRRARCAAASSCWVR